MEPPAFRRMETAKSYQVTSVCGTPFNGATPFRSVEYQKGILPNVAGKIALLQWSHPLSAVEMVDYLRR